MCDAFRSPRTTPSAHPTLHPHRCINAITLSPTPLYLDTLRVCIVSARLHRHGFTIALALRLCPLVPSLSNCYNIQYLLLLLTSKLLRLHVLFLHYQTATLFAVVVSHAPSLTPPFPFICSAAHCVTACRSRFRSLSHPFSSVA